MVSFPCVVSGLGVGLGSGVGVGLGFEKEIEIGRIISKRSKMALKTPIVLFHFWKKVGSAAPPPTKGVVSSGISISVISSPIKIW